MESMNKFKVLTIIVLCMFFFIVAAIYTNTKEASRDKAKAEAMNQTAKQIETVEKNFDGNEELENMSRRIDVVNSRLDELSEQVTNNAAATEHLKCSILGSMTSHGPEELSPEAALQELKINGNDLLIVCKY